MLHRDGSKSGQRVVGCALAISLAAISVVVRGQVPLGSAFTYQGRLLDGGVPADGSYDLQFTVYDAATGGNAVGAATSLAEVPVHAGLFTVSVDFGANVFGNTARWLQIAVRPGGTTGTYTILAPRQPLSASPTAQYAILAGNAATLGGQPAASFQARISGACPSGSGIQSINGDGTVSCYASLASGGVITTGSGGTGATTAPGARANLGAAASGANNDITSLTALSTPLSVAQGGTGSTTGTGALAQLGAQPRIAGTCLGAGAIQSINGDGTVSCYASLAAGSVIPTGLGGTGATTAPGARANLGAAASGANNDITSLTALSTPLSVAQGGTGSTTGTGALAQLGAQPRITGTCFGAGGVQAINGDGTLKCASLPQAGLSTMVVDGSAGKYTSMTIGRDGLPLISYSNSAGTTLSVAHCSDLLCTDATRSVVSSNASVLFTSIAIGSDGLGVIAFRTAALELAVAHCGDVPCTTSTVNVVDSGNKGSYPSIAIANGLPLISYYNAAAGDLRLAQCNDVACASATGFAAPVDNSANVGQFTSLAVINGSPVISYYDATNRRLKVALCTGGAGFCTAPLVTISVLDPTSTDVGPYSSIAIGADGLPVISYFDGANVVLKVAHCTSWDCGSGNVAFATVDLGSGLYTSIAIGSDGFPTVSYSRFGSSGGSLNVAHCTSFTCSGSVVSTLDSLGGDYTSISVGSDNLPVVSYFDGTRLKVSHCANLFCSPNVARGR